MFLGTLCHTLRGKHVRVFRSVLQFSSYANPVLRKLRIEHQANRFGRENEYALQVATKVSPTFSASKISLEKKIFTLAELAKFCHNLHILSHHEYSSLIEAVHGALVSQGTRTGFKSVFDKLDECAMESSKDWTVNEILSTAVSLDNLESAHGFCFGFLRLAVFSLREKVSIMTKEQFVLYMIIARNSEKLPNGALPVIEEKLVSCLDQFTADELCIMLIGLFRTKTILTSKVSIDRIVSKIKEHLGDLKDIQISAVLKFFRLHKNVFEPRELFHAQRMFENFLKDFNAYNCVHMLVIGHCARKYNRTVWGFCVRKLLDEMESLRLKDLDKLLECLTFTNTHCFEMVDVVDLFVKELSSHRREQEISTFPDVFSHLLSGLALFRPLDDGLLKKVLEPAYIKRAISAGNPRTRYHILSIATNCLIENPGYLGPMPDKTFLDRVRKQSVLGVKGKGLERAEPVLQKIQNTIEGSVITNILPNDAIPDVVFCETKDGRVVPVPVSFKQNDILIQKPTDPEVKWKVIALGSLHKYQTDTRERVGSFDCRLRLLEKLGYEPVELNQRIDSLTRTLAKKGRNIADEES